MIDVRGKSISLDDPKLLIPMGLFEGVSAIHVFGRNRNCADAAEENVYSVENAATFPATALMTSISQTTDAADVRGENVIIEGVDVNWNAVTQTGIIDAADSTVKVVLGTALLRVNSMRMSADTVIATTVRLHNVGETTDYAIILVGEERSTQAHYAVPLGFTAYMTNWWAHRNLSAIVAADVVDFQLYEQDWAHADDPRRQLVESFLVEPITDGPATLRRKFSPYRKFGPQTDITITASAVSTVADVSAGFDLILVKDSLYATA